MKNLKFRAYDKFNDCFYYSEHPDKSHHQSLADFFTLVQHCIDGGNDVIVERWTEKTDKNGKDIFEGDDVSWKTPPMYGVSTVVFYDGGYRLKGYPTEDNLLNESYAKNCCEIIGNIHQSK